MSSSCAGLYFLGSPPTVFMSNDRTLVVQQLALLPARWPIHDFSVNDLGLVLQKPIDYLDTIFGFATRNLILVCSFVTGCEHMNLQAVCSSYPLVTAT